MTNAVIRGRRRVDLRGAGARDAEAPVFAARPVPAASGFGPAADGAVKSSARPRPSALVLKGEAKRRRENLLVLLERLAEGGPLSREEALDTVLGVIEDAHAAEPVLFGVEAADRFARLNAARAELRG